MLRPWHVLRRDNESTNEIQDINMKYQSRKLRRGEKRNAGRWKKKILIADFFRGKCRHACVRGWGQYRNERGEKIRTSREWRTKEEEEIEVNVGGRDGKDKMDGDQSDGRTKWPTLNLINTSSVLRERVEDRARPRKCQGRNNSLSTVCNHVIEVIHLVPFSGILRTPGVCGT